MEDSLQFYHFSNIDHRRISSTNVLERLNKEIRRRSKVVGIFPSQESYVRLLTCYLMEYTKRMGCRKKLYQTRGTKDCHAKKRRVTARGSLNGEVCFGKLRTFIDIILIIGHKHIEYVKISQKKENHHQTAYLKG